MSDRLRDALIVAVTQKGRVADETQLAIVAYLIEKWVESLPKRGDEK